MWGAELFHADWETDGRADRQTDMAKVTVAVRNLANASESCTITVCEPSAVFCNVAAVSQSVSQSF